MARDRFDDENADDRRDDRDDRDRGERGRDDRRDDDYDERPRRSGDMAAARAKVGAPGLMLILCGLVATLLGGASLAMTIANPAFVVETTFDRFTIPLVESQPPSPQRDAQLAQLREQRAAAVAQAQQGINPVNLGLNLLFMIPSLLILVGGIKMRSLSGYGLAMTGAIFALIPCSNSCVCLAMPFGLWALIVLLNADVKAAFRRPAADSLDR